MEPGDHFLVVYESLNERDLLAIVFLETALKRRDFIVFFLDGDDRIIRHLAKKNSGALERSKKQGTFLSVDPDQAFGKPPNLSSFGSYYRELVRESQKRSMRLSILGEFPIKFFSEHEARKTIERFIQGDTSARRPAFLCMVRKDNLFSLEPSNILVLVESHDSALLRGMPIGKSNGHYAS
jgi:hypothetical protein